MIDRLALVGAVLAVLAAACEAPPVFPGADKRQNTKNARIEGTVVVTSTSRGRVIVLLYDAARPPPPTGTGRPLAFTVVPREALFAHAAEGDSGPFTAPYAFSLVPAGRYLLRGFVDVNEDFIPWFGVTADANAGDVGGAAVDALTRATREIVVSERDGVLTPALDVPVSFSDSSRVPVDRPVFEVAGQTSFALGSTPKVIELSTPQPGFDEGVVHQRQAVFLARLVDDNGDGVPDDANGDGRPDFWPRVVVRKIAKDNLLLDENDLDKNGVLDAAGEDYEHVNPATGATIAADGAPDLVVLAAGFDFTDLLPQLVDSGGRVKLTPTPVTKLKLVVGDTTRGAILALDATNSRAPQVIKGVPAGQYAVTVIQSTGQTWRVPNELAPPIAERLGLPARASQAFFLTSP